MDMLCPAVAIALMSCVFFNDVLPTLIIAWERSTKDRKLKGVSEDQSLFLLQQASI